MSIRTDIVAVSISMLLVAASAARGDESCTCQPNLRKDIVDFSRPPSKVESQNKVRVSVQPEPDPKTGALTIEAQGQAYFPDGVVIVVTARHWKSDKPFASVRTTVKDRVFSAKLGPFTKKIPQGGIVVGAFFIESAQTETVKSQLIKEHYYHNNPPCKHDRVSAAEATFSLGGAEAEQIDEKAEKDEIAAGRKRLLDAKTECDKVLAEVEKKAKGNDAATAALKTLEEDLKAAADVVNRFSKGRQALLFHNRFLQLAKLRDLIREGAQARAAAAGVTVQGAPANPAQRKDEVATEITKVSDDLKGFLDDPHALDTAWDKTRENSGAAAPAETPK